MNASRARERRVVGFAWLALVGIEVLTQLSLKFAGHATGGFDFSAHAFALAVRTPWIWIAAASYCAGFVAWMLILQRSHLSRAYPMSAMVFVAMMGVSVLVLHEPAGWLRMAGAALIVAGILQLGRGDPQADHRETPPPAPPASTD